MKIIELKFDLSKAEKFASWEDFYQFIGLANKKKELNAELSVQGKQVDFRVTQFYVSKKTFDEAYKIIKETYKKFNFGRKGNINSEKKVPLKQIPKQYERVIQYDTLMYSPNEHKHPDMEDNKILVEYEEILLGV